MGLNSFANTILSYFHDHLFPPWWAVLHFLQLPCQIFINTWTFVAGRQRVVRDKVGHHNLNHVGSAETVLLHLVCWMSLCWVLVGFCQLSPLGNLSSWSFLDLSKAFFCFSLGRWWNHQQCWYQEEEQHLSPANEDLIQLSHPGAEMDTPCVCPHWGCHREKDRQEEKMMVS